MFAKLNEEWVADTDLDLPKVAHKDVWILMSPQQCGVMLLCTLDSLKGKDPSEKVLCDRLTGEESVRKRKGRTSHGADSQESQEQSQEQSQEEEQTESQDSDDTGRVATKVTETKEDFFKNTGGAFTFDEEYLSKWYNTDRFAELLC